MISKKSTNCDEIIPVVGDEVQTNSNMILYKNGGEAKEEEITQASMEALNMTHAANIGSESTVDQAQNEVTTSASDQGDLENIEELESIASMNELNDFLDTPEFAYDTITLQKDENSNIDGYVPYNDYREIEEDMLDDTKFYEDIEIKQNGEERSGNSGTVENNNHMDVDTEIEQNEEIRSGNGETVENKNPDENLESHVHEAKSQKDLAQDSNSGRYNLKKLRSQTSCGDFERNFYGYKYNMCQMNEKLNHIKANHNPCFTQMSAKKGI